MHRFWIFPLTLAVVSVPFPQLTFLEALLPMSMLDGHFPTVRVTLSDLGDIWNITMPYNVVIGLVLGLGLALFDWFHKPHRAAGKIASSLLANLWWCGFYITAINAFNTAVSLAVIKARPAAPPLNSGSRWEVLLLLLAIAILNFSAIMWAAIRSITADDVISPRVLRNKLKRSATIEA
jgi:hypothetical protein